MLPRRELLAWFSVFHLRIAPVLLVVPLVIFVVSWHTEPYLFAYSVIALVPLQLAWA